MNIVPEPEPSLVSIAAHVPQDVPREISIEMQALPRFLHEILILLRQAHLVFPHYPILPPARRPPLPREEPGQIVPATSTLSEKAEQIHPSPRDTLEFHAGAQAGGFSIFF